MSAQSLMSDKLFFRRSSNSRQWRRFLTEISRGPEGLASPRLRKHRKKPRSRRRLRKMLGYMPWSTRRMSSSRAMSEQCKFMDLNHPNWWKTDTPDKKPALVQLMSLTVTSPLQRKIHCIPGCPK